VQSVAQTNAHIISRGPTRETAVRLLVIRRNGAVAHARAHTRTYVQCRLYKSIKFIKSGVVSGVAARVGRDRTTPAARQP
jgi:hypothetical protein